MRQSDTKRDISTKQSAAIGRLLIGDTISAAAKAAGVSRSTLHRWLSDDFHFTAALNHERQLIVLRSEAKLWGLVDQAIGVAEDALTEGDRRVAVAVLRGSGLLAGQRPAIGSADPERLELEARAESNDAKIRAMEGSLRATLAF